MYYQLKVRFQDYGVNWIYCSEIVVTSDEEIFSGKGCCSYTYDFYQT